MYWQDSRSAHGVQRVDERLADVLAGVDDERASRPARGREGVEVRLRVGLLGGREDADHVGGDRGRRRVDAGATPMPVAPAIRRACIRSGSPSVASSTATLWVGLARASACACWIAPDSAPAVGVSPSTTCCVSELISAVAAPGSAATSTAGVAYGAASHRSRAVAVAGDRQAAVAGAGAAAVAGRAGEQ